MALNLSVVPRKPELVIPAKSTPREVKAVSDIDNQENLRSHYPAIMFYNNSPSAQGLDPVKFIREALAITLVYYYPFAGRLIEGPDHRLMVDCTAQGVLFVGADSGISLDQLVAMNTVQPPWHYPELLQNVPGSDGILGCPLMLVQVTRFRCGGFALAIRSNHVISDVLGSLQFVTAMSEMAKGASAPSIPPVWKRDLLTARQPPRVTHAHPEYEVGSGSAVPSSTDDQNLVRRSFYFGSEEIKAIRKKLPQEILSSSTFDLITACLWRSRARALQFHPDDSLRVTCAVNMRGKIDLPLGYYGNTAIAPAKVSKAQTLCSSPLEYAVKLVRETRTQATEDYARSAIDYLGSRGTPELSKLANPRNFVVTDLSKLRFEVDFGWGKPIYGGTMDAGTFNYAVYRHYQNRNGEDMVVVPVVLPIAAMARFENELKRLIWEPTEKSDFWTPVAVYSKI